MWMWLSVCLFVSIKMVFVFCIKAAFFLHSLFFMFILALLPSRGHCQLGFFSQWELSPWCCITNVTDPSAVSRRHVHRYHIKQKPGGIQVLITVWDILVWDLCDMQLFDAVMLWKAGGKFGGRLWRSSRRCYGRRCWPALLWGLSSSPHLGKRA